MTFAYIKPRDLPVQDVPLNSSGVVPCLVLEETHNDPFPTCIICYVVNTPNGPAVATTAVPTSHLREVQLV